MSQSRHATTLWTAADVTRLIEQHFPHVHEGSGRLIIEHVGENVATVRMQADPSMIRPGGTVSGLARLGEDGIEAVTTSMTMNFLRRPAPGDILARVRVLKFGRRLVVAEVTMTSGDDPEIVAHATGTYAVPPSSKG
jgi:acyl-coenzyme A thioesterase PaaI-like protein